MPTKMVNKPNKSRQLGGTSSKKEQFYDCSSELKPENAKGELGNYVLNGDLAKEYTTYELENTSAIEYVPYLDVKNNLYKQIYDAVMTSPTNSAILQQKNKLVCGDGFIVIPKKSIIDFGQKLEITTDQKMNLNGYLTNISQFDTNVNEEFKKVVADYNAFGNAYVEITKSTKGGINKYYQRHIPFGNGRIKKRSKNEVVAKWIGISEKWDSNQQMPDDLVTYPLYPAFAKVEGKDGVERSILHIKDYSIASIYYPIPAYISGILHAELEYRIPKFNQSQFNNGFMASYLLQIFGAASNEEAKKTAKDIKEKMTGTGNNHKHIIQFISDPANKAHFEKLSEIYEGSWNELGTIAREQIVVAHGWDIALIGIGVAGQLGNNQQIRSKFDIIHNREIVPIQNTILDKWLNKTLPEAAKFIGSDFGNSQLAIMNLSPVSFLGDIDINSVLTDDEKRELAGYSPKNKQPNDSPNNN